MRLGTLSIVLSLLLGGAAGAFGQEPDLPPPLDPIVARSPVAPPPAPVPDDAAAPAMPSAPVSAPGPAPVPVVKVPSRSVAIAAGTGVLINLPQPASTVISAAPTIARVQPASPTSLFLTGVAPGRTTVVATNESGALIAQFDIVVTGNTGPVGQLLSGSVLDGALPNEPTEVTPEIAAQARAAIQQAVPDVSGLVARAAGKSLILEGSVGTASSAQRIEQIARAFLPDKSDLIDNVTTGAGVQVNVRVRVAEISRSITRELGFNWLGIGTFGNVFRLGLLTGTGLTSSSNSIANTSDLVFNRAVTGLGAISNFGQLGAGTTGANGTLDATIDALAADNLVTILAEPNLTVMSGETASFLAGGEFPVPIAGNSTGGNNSTTTITVEYKPYGVSLAIVPTILADNRLNLRIRPEVSQISNAISDGAVSLPLQGGSLIIPALLVRRAETTVELGSGQSFAIAGLLEHTSADTTQGLPGLGEIPVLGALFKSTLFQRGETELVIVVTPYIVKPASSPHAFRLPTDGFRPATDLDRILFGRQLAPASGTRPVDAGFILK